MLSFWIAGSFGRHGPGDYGINDPVGSNCCVVHWWLNTHQKRTYVAHTGTTWSYRVLLQTILEVWLRGTLPQVPIASKRPERITHLTCANKGSSPHDLPGPSGSFSSHPQIHRKAYFWQDQMCRSCQYCSQQGSIDSLHLVVARNPTKDLQGFECAANDYTLIEPLLRTYQRHADHPLDARFPTFSSCLAPFASTCARVHTAEQEMAPGCQ